MPPSLTVDLRDLEKFVARVKQIPRWYREVTKIIMDSALLIVWSEIPPYPPPPPLSRYDRKGSAGLGGSLGVSMGGGASGRPDIFSKKRRGREFIGRFGSRLGYAPYVIGQHQAPIHQGRWWTMRGVRDKAEPRIVRAAKTALVTLARAIEGKGSAPRG